MSFLKYAATESVSLRQLRDWIVETNKQELAGLCKFASAKELTEHESVIDIFHQLIRRYMSHVKQAGIPLNSDPIATKILKLNDDMSGKELNEFWGSLNEDQRWLLSVGLPESIYKFQKRGDDMSYLATSATLKAGGMDNLADIILDDYATVEKLDKILDKIVAEVLK